jgi:phosphoglycerol transferase MdoB-like AlkP superfamily enzyme
MRKKHLSATVVSVLGGIVLPALVLVDSVYQTVMIKSLVVTNLCSTFVFAVVLLLITRKKLYIYLPTLGCIGLYYLFVLFEVAYKLYTGLHFDVFFFLDSSEEVMSTMINVFGIPQVIGGAVLFLALYATLLCLFHLKAQGFRALIKTPTNPYAMTGVVLGLFTLVSFLPSAHGKLTPAYFYELAETRQQIELLHEDNAAQTTTSDENVFIMQMESGNSLALQGQAIIEGKKYEGLFMPRIRALAKEGVFFPQFWGNSVLTNRAQVNILCGVTNDVGAALSYRPEDVPLPCLPELLARSGYTTLFFRADRLEFTNIGNFMKEAGFTEVHYDDIMRPEDKKYEWGYDDCTFYNRIFDYLEERYPDPKKLFVYTEVSSHHFPFHLKEPYRHLAPFTQGAYGQEHSLIAALTKDIPFIETYLNSFQSQDYCAAEYKKRFDAYTKGGENTHLFMLPDHSWPVGVHKNMQNGKGAFNENFLIFLSYFPPKERRAEFRIGAEIHERFGQLDIIPTIFTLLNREPYQNSFAHAMTKEEEEGQYEMCHIMIQPYSGAEIAVVKGTKKYVYSVTHRTLISFDLETDWEEQFPTTLAEGMTYETFRDTYYCKRFAPLFKKIQE